MQTGMRYQRCVYYTIEVEKVFNAIKLEEQEIHSCLMIFNRLEY